MTPDAIDDHITQRERLRKLEVMQQGRILKPRRWLPDKAELEIIAQHTLLSGWWNTDAGQYAVAGPGDFAASQTALRLREVELSEGYGGGTELAFEFTRFRQGVGAYPIQSYFFYAAGDQYQVIAVRDTDSDFASYSNQPSAKVAKMSPPAGDWRWTIAGTIWGKTFDESDASVHPGAVVPPGNPWPSFIDGQEYAVPPGGYLYYGDGGPIYWQSGARNSYWGGPEVKADCGDPNYAIDVPTRPGAPIGWFQNIEFNCPNQPGHDDAWQGSGGVLMIRYLPGEDFYLTTPPANWYGQLLATPPPGNAPTSTPHAPTLPVLAQAIADARASGLYPAVFDWYDRHLPWTEPKQWHEWLTLPLHAPWRGLVQLKLVNGRALLRGSISMHVPPHSSPIVHFPPEVRHRDDPSYPYRTLVVAQQGDNTGPMRPVALTLIRGAGIEMLTAAHAQDEFADETSDRWIYFDGASFPVDWNLIK